MGTVMTTREWIEIVTDVANAALTGSHDGATPESSSSSAR
jgi:hypothetical protein